MYPLSACVFIRNNSTGAFCLWESLASVLPFVDEIIVMDLGSTDGTLDILKDITNNNSKFQLVVYDSFPEIDAGVFATLANELVGRCKNENVWYFQADEIPHENLLPRINSEFEQGNFDLAFWRIQYRENFQIVKWFPHIVHRVGHKNNFNFVGDGMSTDRTWDAPLCSQYDGGHFSKWGEMGQEKIKPYVDDMITDVSLVGAFLDNIAERRNLHAPFWHEEPTIENQSANDWMNRERNNQNWYKTDSPYNLPHILKWHLGHTRYEVRPELIEAIKANNTKEFINPYNE